MTAALAWLAVWSPTITAVTGGGLALIAAVLLFLIGTALGPDLPVLQCVDAKARAFMHLTAFTWFIRGALVLTSIQQGDRHPHWDMPLSWGMTCGLLAYCLLYIWSQRMPPEVRVRFDRREQARRARVNELLAEGRPADAKLAATSESGLAAVHESGLSAFARRTLESAPDHLRAD